MNNFDQEDFLKNYWQKKPLVIKKVLNEPLEFSPDELAGLSLESECHSRIVKSVGDNFELAHGPFDEEIFGSLPKENWTLLVQEVDHYVDEIYQLRKLVNFIPSWRFDDVMVSYSVKGGTVGPHFDYYDVFILQGKGKRTWKLEGQKREIEPDYSPGMDLKILPDFKEELSFELDEGDMIYIPPSWAHHGLTEEESLSISLGFRAPNVKEMVMEEFSRQMETFNENLFWQDPNSLFEIGLGEIPQDFYKHIPEWPSFLTRPSRDSISWFGKMVTSALRGDSDLISLEDSGDVEVESKEYTKASNLRIAYYRLESEILLYINGLEFSGPLPSLDEIGRLIENDMIEAMDINSSSLLHIYKFLIANELIF